MAWFIGQSAVMIVLAFLLGLLVGWIIWHQRPVAGEDAEGAAAAPTTEAAALTTTAQMPTGTAETTARQAGRTVPGKATKAGNAAKPARVAKPGKAAKDHVAGDPAEPAMPAVPRPRRGDDDAPADRVDAPPAPVADERAPEPIDDLPRVEGIGPKIAAALVDAGIRTYQQVADADEDTLRTAINNAGITFAPSITTWSRQAALLAMGDEEGFQALVDYLIAGREPGIGEPDPDRADQPIDDLARIEGIGPKIAAALVDAGIRTYQQVADADEDTLRTAINKAGITFAPSITTWTRQAKLLAEGDEAGFTDLTLHLVAGRDVSVEEPA